MTGSLDVTLSAQRDIGRIATIDPEQSTVTVTFDGRAVEYDFGDLDEQRWPMP